MTVADLITAVVAVAALVLSIYNAYTQRKDKLPRLQLTTDYRVPKFEDGKSRGEQIYSCRVVNQGSVPTQVRAVRLLLGNDRWVPFPHSWVDDPFLLSNERSLLTDPLPSETPVVAVLPVTLQPFESVRFAAWEHDLGETLRNAGFVGKARFKVGALDSIDKWHTVEDEAEVPLPMDNKPPGF